METLVNCAVAEALETTVIQIECGFTRGFAGLQLIGNPSEVCKDGKERAKAALEANGIFIPAKRLVVSITPGDLKKSGNHFDLPIAVSLALLLQEVQPHVPVGKWLFAAELGLSGELKPVRSAVSFAIAAACKDLRGIVVAKQNLQELAVLAKLNLPKMQNLKMLGFSELAEVLEWVFGGDDSWARTIVDHEGAQTEGPKPIMDFDDMILDAELRKVAIASASGLHSVLLRGNPGTGKSMFAQRLPSILPPMHKDEHLEALKIQSAYSEKITTDMLAGRPPFRSPHHQTSAQALIGRVDQPGELSLAHGGILFLDEFPEFRRDIVEALREPLETGVVRLSRAASKVSWRSRILLIAASNNCPCGWFGSKRKKCTCAMNRVISYGQRMSGPILDRIDMHINVKEPSQETSELFLELARQPAVSQTQALAESVLKARSFAQMRNERWGIEFNRDLRAKDLLEASGLSEDTFAKLLKKIVPNSASNRSMVRMLRVARTLADIEQVDVIREEDVVQAWKWQAEESAKARGEHLHAF